MRSPPPCCCSMRSRFHVRQRGSLTRRVAAAVFVAARAAADRPAAARVRVTIPPGSQLQRPPSIRSRAPAWSRRRGSSASTPRRAAATARSRPARTSFERGASWNEVLDALTRGKGLVHTVTIPEGFALSSIAPLLGRALLGPAGIGDRRGHATPRFATRLDVPTPTLEGYLFPDTYMFAEGTTPQRGRAHARRAFEQVWKPEWNARLQAARDVAPRRHDARVDHREGGAARRGAPGDRGGLSQPAEDGHAAAGRSDGAVRARQARRPRAVQGPRGRLALQHVQARRASLRARSRRRAPRASRPRCIPANVPFLYFVAHPDGHHEFRETFAEHTQARAQIRREPGESEAARVSAASRSHRMRQSAISQSAQLVAPATARSSPCRPLPTRPDSRPVASRSVPIPDSRFLPSDRDHRRSARRPRRPRDARRRRRAWRRDDGPAPPQGCRSARCWSQVARALVARCPSRSS